MDKYIKTKQKHTANSYIFFKSLIKNNVIQQYFKLI